MVRLASSQRRQSAAVGKKVGESTNQVTSCQMLKLMRTRPNQLSLVDFSSIRGATMKRSPQCAEKIQERAKVCRFCGGQQPEVQGGTGTLLLVIGGVFLLAAIGTSISGGDGGKSATPAPPSAATSAAQSPSTAASTPSKGENSTYADVGRQYAWIERGKDQIKTRLKDPDSASFREVHFYSGGGVPVTCGEVNSKNSFGGYTGFERFIAAGSQLAVVESDMTSPSELAEVWEKFCVKAASDRA